MSCVAVFGVIFAATIGIRSAVESWKVRRLIQQLSASTEEDRDSALDALSDMHVDVTGDLIALMSHNDPHVREFAAFSLYAEVPIPYEVVPTFARVLLDEKEEDTTRRWIGDTFTKIAEQAQGTATDSQRKVITALRQAIRSDNELVAANSAYALGEFGPMAQPAEGDLLQLWEDKPTIEVGGACVRSDQENTNRRSSRFF